MGRVVQSFETGDALLAAGIWLHRTCGSCLTQTRHPACRTRNRWCWKMRHLSKASHPPLPLTLPTLPSVLPLLSSTNEPFWAPTTLKASADGHTSPTPGKRQINLLNMELTVTVNGVVLGVISRDEFLFTWRSQQMAGSNLGSLGGATADE